VAGDGLQQQLGELELEEAVVFFCEFFEVVVVVESCLRKCYSAPAFWRSVSLGREGGF